MPGRKLEKKEARVLKPGASDSFEPVYEVTEVYSVEKNGADYTYIKMQPRGGRANELGLQTLRAPSILADGGSLAAFARAVGQDPQKGFDPTAAVGKRVKFLMVSAED